MLAYLLGFSDCRAMFLGKCLPTGAEEMVSIKKSAVSAKISMITPNILATSRNSFFILATPRLPLITDIHL